MVEKSSTVVAHLAVGREGVDDVIKGLAREQSTVGPSLARVDDEVVGERAEPSQLADDGALALGQ